MKREGGGRRRGVQRLEEDNRSLRGERPRGDQEETKGKGGN